MTPPPRELPEPGQRHMDLALPAKVPAMYLAWNVPGLATAATPKDAYALRMLIGVLDEGLSARLESRLVREQRILTAVSSSYNPFTRGDTLFTITAIPAEGHTLEEARQAILDEVNALKTDAIQPDELKRVYAGIIAGNVFQQDSIQEQASQIGMMESLGLGWYVIDQLPENLQGISADDIRNAANRWLTPANQTSLFLKPAALNVGDAS